MIKPVIIGVAILCGAVPAAYAWECNIRRDKATGEVVACVEVGDPNHMAVSYCACIAKCLTPFPYTARSASITPAQQAFRKSYAAQRPTR